MNESDSKVSERDPGDGFAPGPIHYNTAREYFERGVRPTVQRNHANLVSIILAIGMAGMGWSYTYLLPLKTTETIPVFKAEGGRLVAGSELSGNWTPDADSVASFINKWAETVFDINRSTIEGTIASSAQFVVGNAVDQLKELRKKDNPLVLLRESPDLIRTYQFTSVNFIKDDVLLLRFNTITRVPGGKPKETPYSMTVTYVRVKQTKREEIIVNPGGIFISNFNLTEETVLK